MDDRGSEGPEGQKQPERRSRRIAEQTGARRSDLGVDLTGLPINQEQRAQTSWSTAARNVKELVKKGTDGLLETIRAGLAEDPAGQNHGEGARGNDSTNSNSRVRRNASVPSEKDQDLEQRTPAEGNYGEGIVHQGPPEEIPTGGIMQQTRSVEHEERGRQARQLQLSGSESEGGQARQLRPVAGAMGGQAGQLRLEDAIFRSRQARSLESHDQSIGSRRSERSPSVENETETRLLQPLVQMYEGGQIQGPQRGSRRIESDQRVDIRGETSGRDESSRTQLDVDVTHVSESTLGEPAGRGRRHTGDQSSKGPTISEDSLVKDLKMMKLAENIEDKGIRVSAQVWNELVQIAQQGPSLKQMKEEVMAQIEHLINERDRFEMHVNQFEDYQKQVFRKMTEVGQLEAPRSCSTPAENDHQTVTGTTSGPPERTVDVGNDPRQLGAVPRSMVAYQQHGQNYGEGIGQNRNPTTRTNEAREAASEGQTHVQDQSVQAGEADLNRPATRRPVRGESAQNPVHVQFPPGPSYRLFSFITDGARTGTIGLPDIQPAIEPFRQSQNGPLRQNVVPETPRRRETVTSSVQTVEEANRDGRDGPPGSRQEPREESRRPNETARSVNGDNAQLEPRQADRGVGMEGRTAQGGSNFHQRGESRQMGYQNVPHGALDSTEPLTNPMGLGGPCEPTRSDPQNPPVLYTSRESRMVSSEGSNFHFVRESGRMGYQNVPHGALDSVDPPMNPNRVIDPRGPPNSDPQFPSVLNTEGNSRMAEIGGSNFHQRGESGRIGYQSAPTVPANAVGPQNEHLRVNYPSSGPRSDLQNPSVLQTEGNPRMVEIGGSNFHQRGEDRQIGYGRVAQDAANSGGPQTNPRRVGDPRRPSENTLLVAPTASTGRREVLTEDEANFRRGPGGRRRPRNVSHEEYDSDETETGSQYGPERGRPPFRSPQKATRRPHHQDRPREGHWQQQPRYDEDQRARFHTQTRRGHEGDSDENEYRSLGPNQNRRGAMFAETPVVQYDEWGGLSRRYGSERERQGGTRGYERVTNWSDREDPSRVEGPQRSPYRSMQQLSLRDDPYQRGEEGHHEKQKRGTMYQRAHGGQQHGWESDQREYRSDRMPEQTQGVRLPEYSEWAKTAYEQGLTPMVRMMDVDMRDIQAYKGEGDFSRFLTKFNKAMKTKGVADPKKKLALLKSKLQGVAASALEMQEEYREAEMEIFENVVEFLAERFDTPLDIAYRIQKLQQVTQKGPVREYIDEIFQHWVQYILPIEIPTEDKERLLADAFLIGMAPWLRQRLDTGYQESFEQLKRRAILITRNNEELDQNSHGQQSAQQDPPRESHQSSQGGRQGKPRHQQQFRDQGHQPEKQQASSNAGGHHSQRRDNPSNQRQPSQATDANKIPLNAGQNGKSALLQDPCQKCGEVGHETAACKRKGPRPKTCFDCGEEGHFARDCPNPSKRDKEPKSSADKGPQCYGCNEYGHIAKECPKRNQDAQPKWPDKVNGDKKQWCSLHRTNTHDDKNCKTQKLQAETSVKTATSATSAATGDTNWRERDTLWTGQEMLVENTGRTTNAFENFSIGSGFRVMDEVEGTKSAQVAIMTQEETPLKVNAAEVKKDELHCLYIEAGIDNIAVCSMIDTGAQATLMNADGYRKHFQHYELKPVKMSFVGYNQSMVSSTIGRFHAPVKLGGVTKVLGIYVMEDLQTPMLFGDDALRVFGLILDYEHMVVTLRGTHVKSFSKMSGTNSWKRNKDERPDGMKVVMEPMTACRVEMTTAIEPGTMKYVRCRLDQEVPDGMDVEVEPKGNNSKDIDVLAPRLMAKVEKGTILIPFLNMSHRMQKMRRGHMVADVDEAEVLTEVLSAQSARDALENLYEHPKRGADEPEPTTAEQAAKEKEQAKKLEEFKKRIRSRLQYLTEEPTIPVGVKLDEVKLQREAQNALKLLLQDYDDVFMKEGEILEGTSLVEHQIELKEDKPLKQPYRNPLAYRQIITDEVNDMLKKGIIRPSTSPWASPVVIVRKKDGTIRFCVDYRGLNAVTKKDSFPLPRIDDTLATLRGAIFFTTLDLQSGYWQIPMATKDIQKTAFSCHEGLFEHTMMPFGLSNAPATFQRLMQFVLKGLLMEFCMCYLDDVVIFSSSEWEHLYHFEQVLQRLREAGLKLKGKKCEIARTQVRFLGHVISQEGIQPDPEKIEKVKACEYPTSVKQVRQFLGLTGYYRAYVPHYGVVAAPLYDLTQTCNKKQPFEKLWSKKAEEAVDELKKLLTKAPILGYPDVNRAFKVYTDASNVGLGYILTQVGADNVERVIHYGSKKLNDTETRYAVTEKECLAVNRAFETYRQYLLGGFVTVYTDHLPLLRILDRRRKAENITPRLLRMAMQLAEFEYEIKYVPGPEHGNADALSRPPFITADDDEVEPMKAVSKKKMEQSLKAMTCKSVKEMSPTQRREFNLARRLGQNGTLGLLASAQIAGASTKAKEPAGELFVVKGVRMRPSSRRKRRGVRKSGYSNEGLKAMRWLMAAHEVDANLEEEDSDEEDEEVPVGTRAEVEGFEADVPRVDLGEDCQDLLDYERFEYFDVGAPWEQEQIVQAQREDPQFGDLIEYLETSDVDKDLTAVQMKWIVAQEPYYVIWQEVLYRVRRRKAPQATEPIEFQLVVPKAFQELILEMAHKTKYGAHLAYQKVLSKLQMRYYWPGMNRDLKDYIERCVPCARFKQGPNRRGELHPVKARATWHMLGVDVVGPLTESTDGNKYIVTFIDYFTKFPLAFATKNQTASTIVDLIHEHIVPTYGVPRVIVSDQGPAFTSELYVNETAALGTRVCYTSPYHHQANGLVERWNRTLMGMLKPLTELEPERWDKYIPAALFAYRTTVHASTGNTPFFLMFGRDPDIPGECRMFNVARQFHQAEYAEKLVERLTTAWDMAARANMKAQTQYKEYWDRKAKNRDFRIGDLVLMRNKEKLSRNRVGNKFHPEFDRMHRVLGVDKNKLKLRRVGGPTTKESWYNAGEFKHFLGSEEAYLEYETCLRMRRSNNFQIAEDDDIECGDCQGRYIDDLQRLGNIIWVECDFCLQWYHLECVGLTVPPEERIWYCPDCERHWEEEDRRLSARDPAEAN